MLVYIFSRLPLFLLGIVVIVLGFFGEKAGDRVNVFCFIFATYVIGTSLLIFLVCNLPNTANRVRSLIGLSFLQRFAPKDGGDNLLIIALPVAFLVVLEILSVQYQIGSIMQQQEDYFSRLKAYQAGFTEYYENHQAMQKNLPYQIKKICKSLKISKGL